MKVLIVDDESHVRDAIFLLLPWEELGFERIFMAQTVAAATRLIQDEKPELAIVDVVIGNELGTEIMNYINDQKIRTTVIAISGHDDFQYVRSMFILGALEYLLKPIEQDKLYGAVKKAQVQIGADPQSQSVLSGLSRRQNTSEYQQDLLRNLFQAELVESSFAQLLEVAPQFSEKKQCRVLHCTGSTLSVHQDEFLQRMSRLLNQIQEELESVGQGVIFQNMQPSMDIVILLYGPAQVDFDRELHRIKELALRENCAVILGSSRMHAFPNELRTAWKEAMIAADHNDQFGIFALKEYDSKMSNMYLKSSLQKESALYSSIIIGDLPTIKIQLQRWAEIVMNGQPHTIGLLRLLWEEFFQLYNDWERAAEITDEDVFLTEHIRTLGDILGNSWDGTLKQMYKYFITCIEQLIENKKLMQESPNMMARVTDYLELNYMKRISQQECADHFHINKDYLSRAFKKHTGIGMVKYLNNIRIRKACELLTSTDLQIMEIADQVGYFDAKYFSRQFKVVTGVSPAQYRYEYRSQSSQII